MADVRGRDAKLAVSAAGSSYTDVAGAKDVSFSINKEKLDVTDWNSGAWKEHLTGRKTITMSVEANYDEADAGLDIVNASAQADTQIYFRYRPRGDTGGADQMIFKGTIDSFEDSSPNDDAAQVSFSVEATGAVTFSTQ